MKRLITLVLLAVSIFANTSQAQSAQMIKLDGVNVVPTTEITTTLTIKKESIRSGPYARFSQKFLGVIAPLTDKDIYTIVDSKLAYRSNVADNKIGSCSVSSNFEGAINSANIEFSKVTEDRLNNITTSPEEMARSAAKTIFSLRKSRIDLITGEAGENVFNGGLQYALMEIEKLEKEIIALFIGKQMVSYETRTFNVVPEKGQNTYIIARFSPNNGLVSETDISGQPVAINIQVEEAAPVTTQKRNKKSSKNVQKFLVPAQTVCQLFNGNDVIGKLSIQIFQLGNKIELPIPEVN